MCVDNQRDDTEGEDKMRKFILKETTDCIPVENFDSNDRACIPTVVATFVPDSSTRNKIYFLVGNKPHKFYFTNLYGQNLGKGEYDTPQEAIRSRILGTDCDCNKTEVYLFKNIQEAINKLGG